MVETNNPQLYSRLSLLWQTPWKASDRPRAREKRETNHIPYSRNQSLLPRYMSCASNTHNNAQTPIVMHIYSTFGGPTTTKMDI